MRHSAANPAVGSREARNEPEVDLHGEPSARMDPIAGRMASAVRAPIWEMGVGVRWRGELRGHGHGVAMVAAARCTAFPTNG